MRKSILLIAIILLSFSCQKPPKTGFVDTEKIFKEYEGSKALEKELKAKQEKFSKKYDSLVQQWRQEVMDFQSKAKKLSPKKLQQKDQELYQKQQMIQQMQQQEGAKITAEIQAKNDSIVKEVYKFIDNYGKQNNFEYIFGKNTTGSVLYGKSQNDLTEKLLKALNDNYSKK